MNNVEHISFLDYDKISDTLIRFNQDVVLKFNVFLANKDRDGRRVSFHLETKYPSKYSNVGDVLSIKRNINFYFSIENRQNFEDQIILGIRDIFFFKMLIEKNILPWFMGKSIYGLSPDNGKLIIKGKWQPQQFAISDYKYLTFMPIVVEDENGKTDYGIRMIINNPNNFVDMDLNKFSALYYIITQTDMYSVACSMVNYVKTMPYGVNVYDMNSSQNARDDYYSSFNTKPSKNNFFNNL